MILIIANATLTIMPMRARRAPACRLLAVTFDVGCCAGDMTKNIIAAVYETHGNPADVLRIETQPWPKARPDEAVVQMRAAPINPADLNAIEGKYPVRPALPATPGMEGAGVVVELGSAVRNLAIGTLVILPHGLGTWREAGVVAAEKLVAVPEGIEPIQAAMLKV